MSDFGYILLIICMFAWAVILPTIGLLVVLRVI